MSTTPEPPPSPEAAARKSRPRRWLRVSLRAVLLAVVVIALLLARVVNHARNTREAAEAIERAGGAVRYDWQMAGGRFNASAQPPRPAWLRRTVGEEYFEEVVFAGAYNRPVDDSIMIPIGRLEHLESLDLRRTAITSAGLAHLRGSSSLKQLWYANEKESGACLAHLQGLAELQLLDVRLAIEDAHLAYLVGLTKLETLMLRSPRTHITDAGLLRLGRLPNVTYLDIRNSRITSEGLAQFQGLARLETLALENSSVQSLEPIRHCRGLRWLFLNGSPVHSIEPLGDLPELRGLHLENAAVDDEGLATLAEHEGLEALGLSGTKITDRTMETIGRLKQLRVLTLSGTQISDEGLKQLSGLSRLQLITLSDTAITDAGLAYLAKLPGLSRIHLENTHTTPGGIVALRKTHPRALIEHESPQEPVAK